MGRTGSMSTLAKVKSNSKTKPTLLRRIIIRQSFESDFQPLESIERLLFNLARWLFCPDGICRGSIGQFHRMDFSRCHPLFERQVCSDRSASAQKAAMFAQKAEQSAHAADRSAPWAYPSTHHAGSSAHFEGIDGISDLARPKESSCK